MDLNFLQQSLLAPNSQSLKIVITLGVLLGAWTLHRFSVLVLSRNVNDPTLEYSWRKVSFYSIVIGVIILIGRLWLQGIQPLLTFLSIVAAALTITQKESLMNMMGSLLILWRDLFVVGDRVEVGEFRGDVIGFGIFYFSLMEISPLEAGEQSTGRIIKVPNGMVLTHAVCNYTKSFPYIWHEFPVAISSDSNWEKAKGMAIQMAEKHTQASSEKIQKAIRRIPNDEVIVLGELKPIIYVQQKIDHPTGFILQLRFLCNPRKRRHLQQQILEDLFKVFDKEDDIHLVNTQVSPVITGVE